MTRRGSGRGSPLWGAGTFRREIQPTEDNSAGRSEGNKIPRNKITLPLPLGFSTMELWTLFWASDSMWRSRAVLYIAGCLAAFREILQQLTMSPDTVYCSLGIKITPQVRTTEVQLPVVVHSGQPPRAKREVEKGGGWIWKGKQKTVGPTLRSSLTWPGIEPPVLPGAYWESPFLASPQLIK